MLGLVLKYQLGKFVWIADDLSFSQENKIIREPSKGEIIQPDDIENILRNRTR